MTRPNVLLIVADCLRSDYFSGEIGQAETPFLDRMGQQGVLFNNMISTMSITTPNFTSILSGRYPVEHGVRFLSSQRPKQEDLTLIPHLKNQGYHTYALMTGPLFEETGLAHGFDYYECRNRSDYLDSDWGDRFIEELQTERFKEPWVILLHLWELHQPRRITAESTNLPGTPYEKAMGGMDRQIKRVWHAAINSAKHPIIGALTGDHGEWVETNKIDELWRKGLARLRKITMPDKPKANWHGYHIYDYLTKVPLLIWGEPIAQAVSKPTAPINQQIRQIDLLPTLIDAARLPKVPTTTGQSAWPLAKGQPLPETPAFLEASGDTILLQSPKWVLGVRHNGWKYIYRPQIAGQEELYDLTVDPAEQHNIANKFKEKASQLRRLIETDYIGAGFDSDTADLDLSATEQRLRDLGYF